MIERTEGIVLMLLFLNMLQPLVLPSKRSDLRGAGIIRTLPRPLIRMLCGVVSLQVMLVPEWLFVGAVTRRADEEIRMYVV